MRSMARDEALPVDAVGRVRGQDRHEQQQGGDGKGGHGVSRDATADDNRPFPDCDHVFDQISFRSVQLSGRRLTLFEAAVYHLYATKTHKDKRHEDETHSTSGPAPTTPHRFPRY